MMRRLCKTSSVSVLSSVTTTAVLGFALAVAGCKSKEADAAAEVSVQAEKAEKKALTEYVSGDTVLTPLAQAAIVPKISAPVRRFLVQRGAHVHSGQLLAELENRDLIAAVHDTRGALSQADATYTATTQAAVLEDMQKAKLDVEQAKANLDVQQSVFDSREALLQQGAIPRRDLETARAALVQSKAAMDIAEQHLRSLNSVSQKATIKNAAGVLDSAQGKYEAAQAGLTYSEIRSPIDGVVTDRPLFAGEMANAGQAIVTVMDVSSLIAKVHLSQEQASGIQKGATATLNVTGKSDPISGTVMLVSPALDQGSTTLEVWVLVKNKDAAYKAGMPVHVSIATRTEPDAIAIPNEALISTKAGKQAIMVIGSDGIARQKEVTTGITDGHDTQILHGVKAGSQVITKGAYGMDDGTKVKVVAADGEEAEQGAADDEKPSATAPQKGDQK
ncbi:efflux RND transporter periplasmic adaptor subunit [Terriglobus sp. 2YAB30_2]|uniref:efflux RND transporter periplasmic adaptor subunit n=1 Tax=unclassified Terriglobus TaxID=2628988 RepID=UPI003F9BA6AE